VANHPSAEKRHRQSLKRRARNRAVVSRVKTETKKTLTAIESGDADAVRKNLRAAARELSKAATKGVLKKQTASRRIGRLAKAAHKKLTATT
jgi:small subunit ribosomal protein S20